MQRVLYLLLAGWLAGGPPAPPQSVKSPRTGLPRMATQALSDIPSPGTAIGIRSFHPCAQLYRAGEHRVSHEWRRPSGRLRQGVRVLGHSHCGA